MLYNLIFFALLSLSSYVNAEHIATFLFPLSAHALYIPLGKFFIASESESLGNDFAVASIHRNATEFEGLTPERVTLNNEPDKSNPLFGAGISLMSLLGGRPVVVKKGLPTSIFLIDQASKAVFQAYNIKNAKNEPSGGILALTTTVSLVATTPDTGTTFAAFMAVANKEGNFDGNGSGIAVSYHRSVSRKNPDKSFFTWDTIDAETGASQFNQDGSFNTTSGNKAKALNPDTPEIMISSPAVLLENAVDLHFDRELGRLYIALNVTSSALPEAGARALVVAALSNGKLVFQPIAPETAFNDTNLIVGKRKPDTPTTIYKVRTLQTRTHLRYLVVVGGNGNSSNLRRSVFALPLVDNLESPSHGALASVRSFPVTLYAPQAPHRFLIRVFHEPAEKPADLFTMEDAAARVGGDSMLPGDITDISVNGEAVVVSCAGTTQGAQVTPGIFSSQPIFNEMGAIIRWTDWQRVAGASQDIHGFSYDPLTGIFWYIPVENGTKVISNNAVFKTEWSTSEHPLNMFLIRHFPQREGGVQGLFDFPYNLPEFSKEGFATQIFTGNKKVLFLQTARRENGKIAPFIDIQFPFETKNGSLERFIESSALIFSGGVLAELGPLCCATLVSDGTYGWFVVGGAEGVAVLADNEGRGWDVKDGLGSHFKGLTAHMSWRKLSSTKQVRKLSSETGNLFVLSQEKVERIVFSSNTLNNPEVVTVAKISPEQKKHECSYSDMIISGPLALLATSFGLLRSGDLVDIRTVRDVASAHWTLIPLSESVGSAQQSGPITRLFPLSKTGLESDVAFEGNIYVLNASVSLSQAALYRLAVKLENEVVGPKTVQLFPDFFVKGPATFFANLGDYRNYVVTDGALIALSRSAFGPSGPLLELLSPTLKSGEVAGTRSRVPFVKIQSNACTIGKLLRNSVTGTWMVSGDFGIRIQE